MARSLRALLFRLRAVTLITLMVGSGLKAYSFTLECQKEWRHIPETFAGVVPAWVWVAGWALASALAGLALFARQTTSIAISFTMMMWALWGVTKLHFWALHPSTAHWEGAIAYITLAIALLVIVMLQSLIPSNDEKGKGGAWNESKRYSRRTGRRPTGTDRHNHHG